MRPERARNEGSEGPERLTAGETALHLAALNGNFLSVRILIDAGSDIQVSSLISQQFSFIGFKKSIPPKNGQLIVYLLY